MPDPFLKIGVLLVPFEGCELGCGCGRGKEKEKERWEERWEEG